MEAPDRPSDEPGDGGIDPHKQPKPDPGDASSQESDTVSEQTGGDSKKTEAETEKTDSSESPIKHVIIAGDSGFKSDEGTLIMEALPSPDTAIPDSSVLDSESKATRTQSGEVENPDASASQSGQHVPAVEESGQTSATLQSSGGEGLEKSTSDTRGEDAESEERKESSQKERPEEDAKAAEGKVKSSVPTSTPDDAKSAREISGELGLVLSSRLRITWPGETKTSGDAAKDTIGESGDGSREETTSKSEDIPDPHKPGEEPSKKEPIEPADSTPKIPAGHSLDLVSDTAPDDGGKQTAKSGETSEWTREQTPYMSPFLVLVRTIDDRKTVSVCHDQGSYLWKNVAVPLDFLHANAATAVFGRLLVDTGGSPVRGEPSLVGNLRTVRILDVDTGTWFLGPWMKYGRGGHGITVANGALYVIGGEGESFAPLKTIEKFVPSSTRDPSGSPLQGEWVEEGEVLLPLKECVSVAVGPHILTTAENAIDVHVFNTESKTARILRLSNDLLGCDMRCGAFRVGKVAVFIGNNGKAHPVYFDGRFFFAYLPMHVCNISNHGKVAIYFDRGWIRVVGARQYKEVNHFFRPQGDRMLSYSFKENVNSRVMPYEYARLFPPGLDTVHFASRGGDPEEDLSAWLMDKELLDTEILDKPVFTESISAAFSPRKPRSIHGERVIVLGHDPLAVSEVLVWSEGESEFQSLHQNVTQDVLTRGWAATALSDVIVITGGQSQGRAALSDTYILKVKDMTLTKGPELNSARWGHASASVRGCVFVVGGSTPKRPRASVEMLRDLEGGRWQVVGSLRREVADCMRGVVDNRWLVVAGNECDLQVYDTKTKTSCEVKLPDVLASSVAYGLTAEHMAYFVTDTGLVYGVTSILADIVVLRRPPLQTFGTRKKFGVLYKSEDATLRVLGGLQVSHVGRFQVTRYRLLPDVYEKDGSLRTERTCMPSLPKNIAVNAVFLFTLPESALSVRVNKSCLHCRVS